jgi:hypothetical protein
VAIAAETAPRIQFLIILPNRQTRPPGVAEVGSTGVFAKREGADFSKGFGGKVMHKESLPIAMAMAIRRKITSPRYKAAS